MAFLSAKAFNFSNGQSGDADLIQSFTYLVELEGFDNCLYFLHQTFLLIDNFDFRRWGTLGCTSATIPCVITRCAFSLLYPDYMGGINGNTPLIPKRILKYILILCGERVAPVLAEASGRDAHARGGLTALVLVLADKLDDAAHIRFSEGSVQHF